MLTSSALNSMQQQQQAVPAANSRLGNNQSFINDSKLNADQHPFNNGNIEDATGSQIGSGGNRLCKYCYRCGGGEGGGGSTNDKASLSASPTVNSSTGTGGASPSSPSAPPLANSDRPVS